MFDGVQFHKLGRASGEELKSVFAKYSEINEGNEDFLN